MAKGDVHISLPFVATVILALFLFIPACMVASKLFIRTGQAADSFADLVKDLEDLSGTRGDATKTRVLIMDVGNFIAVFRQESTKILINQELSQINAANPEGGGVERNIYFSYPQDRCQSQSCICLCQEYKVSAEGVFESEASYLCSSLFCEKLNDIQLSDDFAFTRSNKDEPRRVELKLEKVSDQITITKQ